MINILIVDDHLIVREGIKRIINDTPDIKTVAEASSGTEAMDLIWKEKYDLILEGLSQKIDINSYAEMDEWAWLESHKQELAIKKEWIDKETFKVEHTTFTEFDNEDVLRDNIRNAMKKYVDLLSVFDWVYHHDEEYIDEDEIPGDSQQTEMKYEMIKYFDTLCDLRDKFRKSKHVPVA